MSNGVVEALDQTVARLSKALGEDAGKAVEKLYRTASGRLKKSVERTVESDADKAAEIKKIAAEMDKNAGKTVTSDAEREAQAEAQASLRKKLKDVLNPKDPYARPSGFRAGVRDTAYDLGKDADGIVRDPETGEIINKDDPWDMGHKPGYEFRKHQESARTRGIPRSQFLDEHNVPTHYRPETPPTNRSHIAEDHDDTYLGP